MTEYTLTTLLSVLVFVLVAGLFKYQSSTKKYSSLPPGPPSGIFGTRLSSLYHWRQWEEWTKQYGPVFTIWQGQSPLIVIGTVKAVQDLLEKQSGVTASRPRSIVGGDYISGNMRILLVQYGDQWRKLRKLMHQQLTGTKATTYQPIQTRGAHRLVLDVLKNPEHFIDHPRAYAASVVLDICYGMSQPVTYSTPVVAKINECGQRLGTALRPGAFLVESFPILRHFPGAWKSLARGWHREELALFRGQLDSVKEGMAQGEQQKCFVMDAIENRAQHGLNDNELSYAAGSLFGAGSETTASAINIAIMASACFPETQRKVQEELDSVIGRERAPTWEDQDDLPYLGAFIKEVLRWRPVSSGGFIHSTIEDIAYNGYFIPKGTSIVGNHWSIHRDPSVYPDPENFIPERYLKSSNPQDGLNDLPHFTFGFGRRICVGKEVALRSLFITISNLLWTFNIGKKIDPATGKEIEIDTLAFTNTANSHPLPFQVNFEKRIPESIIVREMEQGL